MEPATADHVLDKVAGLLKHYVVFHHRAEVTAVALWIAHTHVLDAFDVTPYLHLHSAEKRSGKTRLLEIIEALVPRPWRAVAATEAVLFRKITRDAPVLLLDEVDAIFTGPKSKTPIAEGLRSVLNAGYRRGAVVPRCGGKNYEQLVNYEVFGAKALAGIRTVPDTIADRSIPIHLRRRKKGEPVVRFRFRELALLATPIRETLADWGAQTVESLGEARPDVPARLEESNERAAEVWEPLFAIADAVGPKWSAAARKAACDLHPASVDTESEGVLLLAAIKATFEAKGADRLLTVDLLATLVEREGEPWAERWGHEVEQARKKGTTPLRPAAQLAGMLRPFDIQPVEIRMSAGEKGKGYKLNDFADAFERYVAANTPLDRDTATTVAAEGVAVSRSAVGSDGTATAETLGPQGLSRCGGSKGGFDCDPGSARICAELFEVPPSRPRARRGGLIVAVAMALLRGALKALKRDGGAAELRAVGPAWAAQARAGRRRR
jgi:hypothetical protein